MMTEEEELMTVIMDAAIELIQTYNSGLSKNAIKIRMNRIARDVIRASDIKHEDGGEI